MQPFISGKLCLAKLNPQVFLSAATVSSSAYVMGKETLPSSTGEHGRRERNYQRNKTRRDRVTKEVDMKSLLKRVRETGNTSKSSAATLNDVLASVKTHIPSSEKTRRRLGMPARSPLTRPEKEVARLRRERLPENSIYPTAGPRLGIFNKPGPETKIMPPAPPNLAEREHSEMVASMQCLKPTNQFELDMTDVAFPRQFPIDNETANNIEDGVGFEDHVLLNHMLKGFPSRGPVRHFIEMVVTGLSKNPHYTAQEKKEHVQWYRDYFAQFSEEELQAIKTDSE